MLGAVYNSLNNLQLSIFWFKTAINCDELKSGFNRNEFKNIIPYLELTKNYYLLGDIDNSYYYHNLCLKVEPENESVKHNIKFFENYFKTKH